MADTIKEWEKEFDKDKKVEQYFIKPLKEVLLAVKLVEKDKERNAKTPYIKAEIIIPHDIATNIKDLLATDWSLALMGIKHKK